MMKRIALLFAIVAACLSAQAEQTMWVCTGQVKYAYNTADLSTMPYTNGTTITILDKVFNVSDIDSIYVDNNVFDDDNILVNYAGNVAQVTVAGNIASHITATSNAARVVVLQDATVAEEYIYTLQGNSNSGSFYQDGSYKITVNLNGLTLNNPDSAAINIRDGKRIQVTLVNGTTNTLTDGANGSQKGCFAIKGHTEFTGGGTLNITGNTKNAFWGKEYVEFKKKLTGTINILGAVGDGFNVNQYIKVNGGNINISGVGDDGFQLSLATDDNGNVETDEENTGIFTMNGGTINITTTAAGAKGIKADVDYVMTGGSLTVNQTGGYVYDGTDPSYCAGVKVDGNINVTGGTINVTSTADGGRGLNADGTINIDNSAATTNIDIKANGSGGVLDTNSSGSGGSETPKSYRVYIAKYSSYSSSWNSFTLYKSDGTSLGTLTNYVDKSSGYSTVRFYYYDFGGPTDGTFYFKGSNSNYQTETFSAPDGTDVYYQVTNSYTGSNPRIYKLSNVTSQYGGTSETGEDNGESYNASGIKADGNVTIGGGTITIANSGKMSKSIKTKATCTINGGNITLTPSGAMQVINNDASYSTGIKAVDFVMNDGTLGITSTGTAGKGISTTTMTTNGGTITVNNSGAAQAAATSGDYYTAKAFKADGNMNLLGGTINITMTGKGGKGIKVNGNYVQGNTDTTGPTLTVSTTGSAAGTSSGGGGMGPGGGSSVSGSAKGVKVEGTITINGGTTKVSATGGEGSEGIESKSTMTINGGYIECNTYDDALNCASHMYIKGGYIYAVATNNDALDSNGNMYLSGGMVFCYGSEEGLDANSEGGYKVYIQSGANIAAIGRTMGAIESGASMSQSCYQTTASSNTWYALYNGNTVVAAFQVPTLSSGGGGGPGGGGSSGSTMVVTSPSCKLYSGVTGSGTSFWSGKGYSNASGGSSVSLSNYSGGGGW